MPEKWTIRERLIAEARFELAHFDGDEVQDLEIVDELIEKVQMLVRLTGCNEHEALANISHGRLEVD